MNRLSLQRCVPNGLEWSSPWMHVKFWCGKGMKKFWNNQNWSEEAHDLGQYTKIFLKISQYSLAGKTPALVPVSGSGTADIASLADPEAGWLEVAMAREPAGGLWAALAIPWKSCVSSLAPQRLARWRQRASLGKYISFKTKARKPHVRGMFGQHTRPGVDCLAQGRWWCPPAGLRAQARASAHQESCRTEDVTSAGEARLTPMYSPSWPEYLSSLFSGLVLSPEPDITEAPAPEAVGCVVGEVFLLQSSELEEVEVGVIGTELLLLPEQAFDLFMFLGFRFLVWIPSFFIASGRGTPCSFM